ncbi:MAG: histidine triad nucleotide-binding protein [Pseudomonadota bacterium]|nr:MAG: histidine triad nucleotide-binding protein [Pseudomonadota bacterium]
MDCIFCRIANGEIKGDVVYQDDEVVGFRDLNPQAPHHVLFVPRRHVATVNEFDDADATLIGKLVLAAGKVAADLGVADEGYRLVTNCNGNAGQTVFHVHLHMLAGRVMRWPPG